ncbi:MAG: helix-turn-helix transcriptional regulator [Sulfurimonas sp.]|uniref:helix-turn-helix domain-containing protein n=1 Tax=Sulfurimonas sp. TaxID=2022749 RepID=UPI0026365810|nr:helix-turn-helix transcriptional regulator [Sulfurimonas sp.]MDD5401361.1 helix-turn-helix transcriptional regulator [Sulfurimonas sp.]
MLQAIELKLKSTGEIPSEQTIYGYLNGKRELKAELIPYIAEVLEVDEQELFRFDIEYASEYNIRYFLVPPLPRWNAYCHPKSPSP